VTVGSKIIVGETDFRGDVSDRTKYGTLGDLDI
jgi:hypothetical protein